VLRFPELYRSSPRAGSSAAPRSSRSSESSRRLIACNSAAALRVILIHFSKLSRDRFNQAEAEDRIEYRVLLEGNPGRS